MKAAKPAKRPDGKKDRETKAQLLEVSSLLRRLAGTVAALARV